MNEARYEYTWSDMLGPIEEQNDITITETNETPDDTDEEMDNTTFFAKFDAYWMREQS
jgi:hypothetical protein